MVTYLQLLDVYRALVHTVLAQGNVEMTGEARLSQLQPASDFLQTVEQGNAEGGAGRGRRSIGSRFWGFRLPHFFPFNVWWTFESISIYSGIIAFADS